MARTTLDPIGGKMRAFNVWVAGQLKVQRKTQKQLAEYIGLDVSNVSRRLHGSAEWSFREVLKTEEFLGEEFQI